MGIRDGPAQDKAGKAGRAIASWKKTVELEPDYVIAHVNLAKALKREGKVNEAANHYRQALKWCRKSKIVEIENNIAWLLATHKEAKLLRADEAIEFAQDACRQTGRENPGMLDTLAAAYAAAGKFSEAVSTAETAFELAKSSNEPNFVEQINLRLQLYKAFRPYHETSQAE